MSQIKYIISACFICLCFLFSTLILRLFFSSNPFEDKLRDHSIVEDSTPNATIGLSKETLEGKTLFQQNCQTCHALNKDLTGPALSGVTSRGPWGNRKEIYKWVHNPPAYIASDKTNYTKALQQKYKVLMSPFPGLSEKDIDKIIAYVEISQVAYVAMP